MGMLLVIRRIYRGSDICENNVGRGSKSECSLKTVISGSF